MAPVLGAIAGQGRSIVTNGLAIHVDASLSQSYPGSGTVWYNLGETVNNLSLVSSPTYSTTNGGVFTFNGSNYASASSNVNITGNAPRTLCAWIYPTSVTGTINITRIGSGANGQLYELLFDGTYIVGHFWGSGWALSTLHGKAQMLNTWSYMVMAYDGTTVYHYVDGVLKGSGNFNLVTGNNLFHVAVKAYSAHTNFIGNISTGSLYSRCLSADEVLQNYQSGRKIYST